MPETQMWFGTTKRMMWIPVPLSGADTSSEAWNDGGVLLNGGGYEQHSWGSHKQYVYAWSDASSRQAAQLIKSYRDGAYGRGILYLVDPLTYDTNVLPARVAYPALACDDEGASMVYGLEPDRIDTSNWAANELPVDSAFYDLTSVTAGFRGVEDAVYIPIPPGFTLFLGAFYDFSGSGGIFVTPQDNAGSLGAPVALTAKAVSDTQVVTDTFSDIAGVWIWLGKSASGSASVTAHAMIARLLRTEYIGGGYMYDRILSGPWIGGQGNSGLRFMGVPTYIENSGVDDGQIGYAASFREVGSWIYG